MSYLLIRILPEQNDTKLFKSEKVEWLKAIKLDTDVFLMLHSVCNKNSMQKCTDKEIIQAAVIANKFTETYSKSTFNLNF